MTDRNDILTSEAKHLVVAVLGIDLTAWQKTDDRAWVSFAARLLKQQTHA
jgi:hypothetical protein